MTIFKLSEQLRRRLSLLIGITFLGQLFSPFTILFTNPYIAYADDQNSCGITPGSSPATTPDYGGVSLDKAAIFLADMDDITGAYFDEEENKIVFIGSSTSTLPEFDKDDLAVAIRAVIFNNTNPAVSIDFKDPGNPEAHANMDVTYYGGIENTNFGQVLFDADLALKIFMQGYDAEDDPVSTSVPGYQSVLTRWVANGPDTNKNAISRYWISPQTITLKEATSSDAFVFDQVVMQVETEPLAENMDPAWVDASDDFVAHQTQYYDAFAQEVPSYLKAKQLAKIVGVVKWIKDNQIGVDFEWAKNYEPVSTSTPAETPLLVTPTESGYYAFGGVEYSTANSYGTDTQGTSTALMTASMAAATSSADGIHWDFNSGGQAYESVAVSAELFKTIGAYTYSTVDTFAPTPSTLPLELRRTYSSFAAGKDIGFGPGWSILPASLSNTLPGFSNMCTVPGGYSGSFPYKLAAVTPGGRESFTFSCPGGYEADDARFHSTLTRDPDGTFRVLTKDRTTSLFYTGVSTTTEYKLIQSYDIHSGDPSSFVRKYHWGNGTTTLLTIQDLHPNDSVPTSSNGHNIAFGYNGNGQITSVTGPSGTIQYGYDGNGDLITAVDARNSTTTYTYETGHLLESITDRMGTQVINNTYDPLHRVLTQLDVNGVSKTVTYDEEELEMSWADSNGRIGINTYDEEARLARAINAIGATTTFGYGTTTNAATSIVDARNGTSTFAYDSDGNLTSYTAPNGGQVSFSWDASNNLTETSDSRYTGLFGSARKSIFTYDGDGNVTQSTIGGQATTTYTYTPRGQLATSTDSTSNTTQFFYNSYGLPTQIQDKLGQTTTYTYDNAGRVTQLTHPGGMVLGYSYDANSNKLTASTSASVIQYAYDANDRLTSTFDPVFATTTFSYTRSGNLATTTNPLSISTHYFYDTYNNLTTVRDGLSRDTMLSYDAFNRETSYQLPSNKTHTTQYDILSNPIVVSQPNGTVATSTYDSLNRVISTQAGATTTTYSFDAAGRLTSVAHNGISTSTYSYDVRDRVTQVTNPFGATVQYLYNALDDLTKITYPDSKTVQNQFNAAGQVTQQTDWTGGATAYTYTAFSALSTTTLPNGVTIKREYDTTNRLATTTYKNSSQVVLFRQAYVRDARGFVTQMTEDGTAASTTVTTYQYDLAGRLTNTASTAINKTYGYDAVGNLTTLGSGTATTTYNYSIDDELATSTTSGTGDDPVSLLDWAYYAIAPSIRTLAKALPQRLAVAVLDIIGISKASEENKYKETAESYAIDLTSKTGKEVANIELRKENPEVRLKKWNGEIDLGVSYERVKAAGMLAPSTDRVEWKGPSEEVHAYPLEATQGMEEGGFEVEVYLKQKPMSNVFEFKLDGVDNLDFLYQPALTAEEIEQGGTRPENVIGSYAVYHKEKHGHEVGKTDYATGKAFHIYRPKAIDARGNETWAVLSYSDNALSVTVPQSFLDTAIYPVRVDPTFGYTSSGASYQDIAVDNNDVSHRVGNAAALTEGGTLTSLHASLDMDGGSADTIDVTMFLSVEDTSSDSHSQSAKIERTDISWTTTDTFYTFTASDESLTADDYILNIIADGADVAGVLREGRVAYDSSGSRNIYAEQYNFGTYTTGRDESPWTETDAGSSRIYSMYATYSAGSNQAPIAPTALQAEGQTDPTNISDSTPEFSAIYNDPDASDEANKYRIQVATSSAFTSAFWDSGTTTMATTTQGNRSPEIPYGGTDLASSTTYYWRVAFTDDDSAHGIWSTTTATFTLAASGGGGGATTATSTYTYDGSGNLLTTASTATSTRYYSWNSLGLLASTTINGISTIFNYDAERNRIAKVVGNGGGGGATTTDFIAPSANGLVINEWGDPTNVYTSNDLDATAQMPASGPNYQEQDYYNFGFDIPAGATVQGIEVAIEGQGVQQSDQIMSVKLSYDGGSNFSSTKTTGTFQTAGGDEIETLGGSTDTWGRSWSDTEFASGTFVLWAWNSSVLGNRSIAVDQIRVKVYYTPAGGGTTRYVNDVLAPNALVLAETDGSDNPTRLNVWGPNGLISTGGAATTTRYYPLTDSQGSVRFLTDSTGTVVRSYTYTPYGTATTTTSSASTTPYQYTSENLDSETGLTFLRARYYDSTTGRFISRDPVRGILSNPITQNPYIYALDNPTTYSDPSGEFIPLLLLGWAAIELGLTIWDGYDAVRTVTDDCATGEDKALALSLFAVGLVAPGGGYGKADDVAKFLNKHIRDGLAERGWTEQLVNETLNSSITRKSTNKFTGNPATAYYTKEGAYVVRDNVTGGIVQISDNIDPAGWRPDSRIIDPYMPWKL
ncbi:hypothetical protein A2704_05625 [Candidatus Kaiserbacteria bacterium RIFCSPHIGHO2_01_FULL_54_36b]|uniref:Uncharacterized protein n=1 Tax=Candidatus Kaiserbacteria bacterium RIFCSPHIGHO2_01_FULL_54_36b TaxID=1798483 RepID=A0A1F6CMV1_9BACT|nr:MAG: hypothetical protein A2704_05625 [Candidatus Kaiserbacteria bacterium RIFCSPHIGHO2_01_FULL_54_36b]